VKLPLEESVLKTLPDPGKKIRFAKPAIAHNFSLGPRAFWPPPRLFDESALVTLIKIHPQTKQKHKEAQNKKRGVGK
jgi:hypothetical protein